MNRMFGTNIRINFLPGADMARILSRFGGRVEQLQKVRNGGRLQQKAVVAVARVQLTIHRPGNMRCQLALLAQREQHVGGNAQHQRARANAGQRGRLRPRWWVSMLRLKET